MVERNSSPVILLSSCTSTFAAKIVRTMFDEVTSKRLIGFLCIIGAGVEDTSNRSDRGGKNSRV